MQCLIREEWRSTPAKAGVLAALTVFLAILTYVCLSGNTQVVFTHLYYIPIILAAYWFGKRGVLYAAGLAVLYLWAVFTFSTVDTQVVLAAMSRALMFIGIALVIALLSLAARNRQEMVALSEEKFRGIWENIQAAIVLIDPETHTIIAANPEAAKLTGFSFQEMQGHTCHEYICPACKGQCPISDLGLTLHRTERVLLTRDGRKIPVFKTVTDTTVGGKRCFIETYIDITPVKEAENALLAYLREATLRTRNPVELVRDNLREIREGFKDQQPTPDAVATALAVQERHIDDILGNLRELERAVADKRTEIPDALREYLQR
jgi:PAS domain S-box-containing protein